MVRRTQRPGTRVPSKVPWHTRPDLILIRHVRPQGSVEVHERDHMETPQVGSLLPYYYTWNPNPYPNPLARYIYSNRDHFCRSVHDLQKSAFDNQKYSPVAWKPLVNWVYGGGNRAATEERLQKLTKFNRDDTDLHEVVALGLWRLGSQGNHPWGRAATRPSFYCQIPKHEKVAANKDSALTCFFFSTAISSLLYV